MKKKDSGSGSPSSSTSSPSPDPSSTPSPTPTATYGVIFKTTATVTGLDAWSSNGAVVSPLDTLCTTEASSKNLKWFNKDSNPDTQGVYRAIVAFSSACGGGRTACSTANCSGGASEHVNQWPLKANSEYRREDYTTVIGTTDASGLLQFPLTNAISAGASPDYAWTGMINDWTTSSTNCFSAISNQAFNQGAAADITSTTSSAIGPFSFSLTACHNSYPILCAEVLPTVIPKQGNYRKIFVTTNTYNASIGIGGLDSACQTEANSKGLGYSGKAPYKALVQAPGSNGGSKRLAIYALGQYIAGPSDWVMEANREYRREDGTTVIGTTNAQAIFDLMSGDLTNSITGTSVSYFTGFGRTDLFYGGNPATPFAVGNVLGMGVNENCVDFTSNLVGYTARIGSGDAVNASAFGAGTAACNVKQKILCVEQSRGYLFYD